MRHDEDHHHDHSTEQQTEQREWGVPGRGGRPGRRLAGHRRGGPGHRGRGRGGRRRRRISRGDVRQAVLAILAEEPMHGYQIMQELEERSGGLWQPSPGSVYPTLQQLADEGLVAGQPVDGRNVFRLTEAGASAAGELDGPPPWERLDDDGGAVYAELRRSMRQLVAAGRQVAMAGTRAQAEAADQILRDARRSLYRLLADDEPADQEPGPGDSASHR